MAFRFMGPKMDSLIYFGDSIKALDDKGKIGGYLVRFSGPDQKDLTGEYFTAETYLGAQEGNGADTIFHHGQPLPVKARLNAKAASELAAMQDHIFAPVKTKRDAVGIWAETVLDMADEYEKTVFGLVKAKKLGWSSGAVGHLVRKNSDGQITRWPIGEASITPTPAEPLNRAIPVKSIESVKFVAVIEDPEAEPLTKETLPALAAKLNQHIEDLADDGRSRESLLVKMADEAGIDRAGLDAILTGADRHPSDARLKAFARSLDISFDSLKAVAQRDYSQSIKGMFEDAIAEQTPSRWQLEEIYSRIIRKLANAASAAQMAGVAFDLEASVKEATEEYTSRLQSHALDQIAAWIEAGGEDEFYLKAIIDSEASVKALASSDLDSHSLLAVSALRDIAGRFRGVHEGRVKAGRVLSEKNRRRIGELMEQLSALNTEMQNLLDESEPKTDETTKRAALSVHLRQQWRARQLGAFNG